MRVTGLDHASVTCADLERSLAFYRDALGIPVRDRGSLGGPEVAQMLGVEAVDADFADLDLGEGRTLELLSFRTPAAPPDEAPMHAPGSGHLSLRVEDLDGLVARVGADATPVTLAEPGFWQGARVVYLRDPDGATVELIERRGPAG